MSDADDALDRSREHRRGVRQACVDLEESLARPAGPDVDQWSSEVTARCHQLGEAFRHHVDESEGPQGLLREIVETAPRLANAVQRVKDEHKSLLAEIARREENIGATVDRGHIDEVRRSTLQLLQDLAAHRQRGSDLIYEAYSVDVEGGDSG
jgi:hypothetical protein